MVRVYSGKSSLDDGAALVSFVQTQQHNFYLSHLHTFSTFVYGRKPEGEF